MPFLLSRKCFLIYFKFSELILGDQPPPLGSRSFEIFYFWSAFSSLGCSAFFVSCYSLFALFSGFHITDPLLLLFLISIDSLLSSSWFFKDSTCLFWSINTILSVLTGVKFIFDIVHCLFSWAEFAFCFRAICLLESCGLRVERFLNSSVFNVIYFRSCLRSSLGYEGSNWKIGSV